MKKYVYLLVAAFLGIFCKSDVKNNDKTQSDIKEKSAQTPVVSDINVQQAKELIANSENLVILDVRTPKETAQGMIENAIELDYRAANFETEVVKLDKSKPYLVYCRSGGRSASASEIMKKNGFNSLYNLLGGYTAWSKE